MPLPTADLEAFDLKAPILVTGASGFVGRALIDALVRAGRGADVIAASRTRVDGVRHVPLSLETVGALDALVEAVRPKTIFHLAAVALPSAAQHDPDTAWRVNCDATRWIAEALARYEPGARFVFASSATAYGRSFAGSDVPVTEDTPLRPATAYGATKAAAEMALQRVAADGLSVAILRAFNHTGPGQSPRYVVASFAEQVAALERAGGGVIEVGNLDVERDFLHVDDVIEAYVMAAARTDVPSGAFNVSTGAPVRINDLLGVLKGLSTVDIEVRQDPERMRADEMRVVSGDPAAARAAFGWRATRTIEETLAAVLEGARRRFDKAPR